MAKRKPTADGGEDNTQVEPQGYTVLARRYRPQLFGDLVGQEAVAQALSNAITRDRKSTRLNSSHMSISYAVFCLKKKKKKKKQNKKYNKKKIIMNNII